MKSYRIPYIKPLRAEDLNDDYQFTAVAVTYPDKGLIELSTVMGHCTVDPDKGLIELSTVMGHCTVDPQWRGMYLKPDQAIKLAASILKAVEELRIEQKQLKQ